MHRKVLDYMKQNKMLDKGDRIVAGVSGGADSVCLLYILKDICEEAGADLLVVHVNHGIRGEEARRDELYVQELCSRFNLEFHSFHYDVRRIAREEGLSEEEAGRKVRYEAFTHICQVYQCNKVAVAHNRNDNAETVLFHLFRGSGIKGLSGIDPVRSLATDFGNILIIRPLLCIERQEIEDYLKDKKIAFQTDATNFSDSYTRNKIRNRVLSYVNQEINQNATNHIADAAEQIKESYNFIEQCLMKRFDSLVEWKELTYYISVDEFREENIVIKKGIVRKVLERLSGNLKDFDAKHVGQVLALSDMQVGKQIHLPYGIIASRGYEDIRLYRSNNEKDSTNRNNQTEPVAVQIPGKVFLPELDSYLETQVFDYEKSIIIPKNSCAKWFDYDKIENAVVIRTRNTGDYIQINRSGGRKKLKDYFIDLKIPKNERDNRLLVTDGNHIMWILGDGNRISEKYKVEDSTDKILLMKLYRAEEDENGR
ncbi:MAG: hypothetical protein K0S76_2510 [Herbinix sp.]|jgi:tRNA(Ile)-lysidine synthase|nr:hypothetical protein [Herbinix sp.]